jgi:hypothetical protein
MLQRISHCYLIELETSDGIVTSINKQVLSFLFLIIMSGLWAKTSLYVFIPWFHKTLISSCSVIIIIIIIIIRWIYYHMWDCTLFLWLSKDSNDFNHFYNAVLIHFIFYMYFLKKMHWNIRLFTHSWPAMYIHATQQNESIHINISQLSQLRKYMLRF